MQCNYDNGRQCPKKATATMTIIGLDFHTCNQHRPATANMLTEQIGPANLISVTELPR